MSWHFDQGTAYFCQTLYVTYYLLGLLITGQQNDREYDLRNVQTLFFVPQPILKLQW